MPRNVPIEIFNVGRTTVDRGEVYRWLQHLNANNSFDPNPDSSGVSDPAFLIALAAKRCYMSFEPGLNPNVSRVRSDYNEYLLNILRQGHGSVLEHSSYTYAIEGVSRVFTAEMNRHRAGWSISEGSLRFIRFDRDIPFWMPLSLCEDPNDDREMATRKTRTRESFMRAFKYIEEEYRFSLGLWDMEAGNKDFAYKKKVTSCLRRMVPMGVATGGLWTGNIRALRHVIAMRTDAAAEEEIAYVFCRIADDIIRREPMLFPDFRRSSAGYVSTYRKV